MGEEVMAVRTKTGLPRNVLVLSGVSFLARRRAPVPAPLVYCQGSSA
jgi:hypothetical protein